MRLRNMLYGTGMVAITFFSFTAQAQEVNLTCVPVTSDNSTPNSNDYGHVLLNEGAKTALFGNGDGNDPVTHATFTDTTVTWKVKLDNSSLNGVYSHNKSYSLSRETGKLNLTDDRFHDGSRAISEITATYQCAVSQKQF
jgi:hypothetical protein